MAKQPEKINEVMELLSEGKTTKEIMDETGCSQPTVSVARKRIKEGLDAYAKAEEDDEVDSKDFKASVDSFIKRIKIKPDKEVMDDPKESDDETEYGCPACGHEWSAKGDEVQESCPNCGEEFE